MKVQAQDILEWLQLHTQDGTKTSYQTDCPVSEIENPTGSVASQMNWENSRYIRVPE